LRTLTIASLAALALPLGCYQQSLKLTVHESGAGTIRLVERIAPADAQSLLDEGDRSKELHGLLVEELAQWDGLAAWTDASARLDDEAVRLEARGWFEDLGAVRRLGADGIAHTFTFQRDGETIGVTWTVTKRGEPLPDTLPKCRAVVAALKRLRIEANVSMPGALIAPDGASEPGYRTARSVLVSGVEIDDELRSLERRLEAGEIGEQEIIAAIRARLVRTIALRARAEESTEAQEAFRRQLDAARASYAGSDLEREVDAERRSLRDGSPDTKTAR